VIFYTLLSFLSNAQITVQNPSFEDVPGQTTAAAQFWQICSASPDIQPNATPCFTYLPYDGFSYQGIGAAPSTVWYGIESFGQVLSIPMIKSKTYFFSIFLSKTANSIICGGTLPIPINFEVWAGLSPCSRTKKLAEIDTIDHVGWREYVIEFTADDNYPFIEFLSNSKDPDINKRGYLLIDNMSPQIIEYPWNVWFTTPTMLSTQSCSYLISGKQEEPPGGIINLHSSLLNQNIVVSYFSSDTSWSAMLNYPPGTYGVDTLTVEVNFAGKPTEFAYDTLLVLVSNRPVITPTVTCGETEVQLSYTPSSTENDSILSVELYTGLDTLYGSGKDTMFRFSYPNLGTFTAWAISHSAKGCRDSVATTFRISDCEELNIPNLITPNGDHKNDFFELKNHFEKLPLKLYNRWGEQIYESEDYQNDWPSNQIVDGMYYYLIEYDGREYKGWVQVLP
jgi:gliding motility-associated-like protein